MQIAQGNYATFVTRPISAVILVLAFIVAGIAWTYVRYGTLPAAAGLLYGIKPVVLAIVAQALSVKLVTDEDIEVSGIPSR